MSEKLQKVLARAGLGSRRAMEKVIADGKVSVNGKIVGLGVRVTSRDKIRVSHRIIKFPPPFSRTSVHELDNQNTRARSAPQESLAPLRGRISVGDSKRQAQLTKRSKRTTLTLKAQRTRILIYSKPDGEICTRNDPEGRATVFSHLPTLRTGRWIAIGRLDINSAGLLLFTNNGELANKLMHPRYQIEREYAVRVLGKVDNDMLKTLREGVKLEDGFASFKQIADAGGTGANHWYRVVICEGRQREVRRLWESQGVKVSRLIRIRYGNVCLPPRLKQGRWQELSGTEVATVFKNISIVQTEQ